MPHQPRIDLKTCSFEHVPYDSLELPQIYDVGMRALQTLGLNDARKTMLTVLLIGAGCYDPDRSYNRIEHHDEPLADKKARKLLSLIIHSQLAADQGDLTQAHMLELEARRQCSPSNIEALQDTLGKFARMARDSRTSPSGNSL